MALPVLVVGAGPAALVAALTLVQNNIPVRIIEKERQFRRGQRGAGIHPRSFEVFHFLRVPEIHDLATPLPRIQLHKTGSVEPLKVFNVCPYTEPTPAIPYYNPKCLGQPNLEGTLRSHLARYGCTVELGTQLASFTQDSTCVHARLKRYVNDGSETEEEIQAAYLIGADGAKGITRKLLGLTFLGATRHEHIILADMRLEAKHLDRVHWHFFGEMPINMITLRPTDELGSDGYQVMISNTARDLTHLLHDEELLVAYIKDTIGLGNDVKVSEVLWLSDFRPNIRMVNKFGVGRVFVSGDAGHVHSPTGGQGMNSAVQDAFNIAWKLALVYKGLSSSTLLETYTAERIPVIGEMLNVTTALHRLTVGKPDQNSKEMMNPEMTAERAMTRGKELYMLGVNYRTSPIVIDEFAPASSIQVSSSYCVPEDGVLRAGDRAPDAPDLMPALPGNGPENTRLFDVFAPTYHTVLIFVPLLSIPVVQQVLSGLERLERKGNEKLVRRMVVLPSDRPTSYENEAAKDMPGEVERGKFSGETIQVDGEVLVDRAGHAYRAYVVGKGETKVVVVRPDGVVGAVVRGAESVGKYFDGIFGDAGADA